MAESSVRKAFRPGSKIEKFSSNLNTSKTAEKVSEKGSIPQISTPLSCENAHLNPGIDEIRAQSVVENNQSAFGIATNNSKSLTTSLERSKGRAKYEFYTS
jgi:hypothetical protein